MKFLLPVTGLLILLLNCCKQPNQENAEDLAYTKSLKSQQVAVELPISPWVSKGPCGPYQGILISIDQNTFQVDGHPETVEQDEINSHLKKEVNKIKQTHSAYLLIAAPPETHFRQIRTAIRAAARAGLTDIFFAVKKSPSALNLIQSKLHLSLPCACLETPDISPMFIKIDRYGAIYINTGPEQEMLDTDIQRRSLPQLSERLESYAAAARAGALEAHVQAWVDSKASYQRAIDLLSATQQVGIRNIYFVDLVEGPSPPGRTCQGYRTGSPPPQPRLPVAPQFIPPPQE